MRPPENEGSWHCKPCEHSFCGTPRICEACGRRTQPSHRAFFLCFQTYLALCNGCARDHHRTCRYCRWRPLVNKIAWKDREIL